MFLLIDKPKGITSHDVVVGVRKIVRGESTSLKLRRIKVGHAGTLDPNATGLLIVGVGRESTKKLGSIAKNTTKTYIAEIILGEERDTDDEEGKILRLPLVAQDDNVGSQSIPTLSNIRSVLKGFLGEQEQVPPSYSAIKIKGKKAYELARKNKKVNLKSRKITIYLIELLEYEYPLVKIEVKVSSGTYIRALARDIGRKLGCGAYLKNLRRTAIGKFAIDNSVKLEVLNKNNWKKFVVSMN